MALSRLKTWSSNETLTSSDQNAEFNNILNNALALISPLTGSLDAGGFDITALDELALTDAVAGATAAGRLRRNGTTITWHDGTAARALLTASQGSYRAIGVVGRNNATTPNTQYDLDADVVILRNSSNETVVRYNPGAAITCNLATVGANGLDTGTQAASTWYHFYWIWNGTTLATIASLVAPTTGPALPSGYTHFAYAGAVRSNASTVLIPTRMTGCWAWYETFLNVLNDGQAIVETAVDFSAVVPPNALRFQVRNRGNMRFGTREYQIRVVTGSNFWDMDGPAEGAGDQRWSTDTYPNISQQLFYLWSATPGAGSGLFLDITGYAIPNGDS